MSFRAVDLLAQDPGAKAGKFILLEYAGQPALVRSSMRIHEFHARILQAYMAMKPRGVAVLLNADESDVLALPPNLQLFGGGYWQQEVDDYVEFWGKSAAFGPFDRQRLRQLGLQAPYHWSLRD